MLKVKKLHPNAKLPTVAHPGEDLGYDLYALEDAVLLLNTPTKIRTGIAVQAFTGFGFDGFSFVPPESLGLLIQDRSSMGAKGVRVLGGVVDPGYTGELIVMLVLLNANTPVLHITAGDKITQMVPVPVLTGNVIEVDELATTARGANGLGSTGAQ